MQGYDPSNTKSSAAKRKSEYLKAGDDRDDRKRVKPEVPEKRDLAMMAETRTVHKLTVAQIKEFLISKDLPHVHGKKKKELEQMVYDFYKQV